MSKLSFKQFIKLITVMMIVLGSIIAVSLLSFAETVPEKNDQAAIEFFKADKDAFWPGSHANVTLSWKVNNAKKVTLNGVEVTAEAIKVVYSDEASLYTLEAEDLSGNKVTEDVNIKSVWIRDFEVDRSDVMLGDTVRFTWHVYNAAKITLNDEVLDSAWGSKIVTPPVGTNIYTFKVYDADNKSRELYQEVIGRAPGCVIDFFKADKNVVWPGSDVTLSWKVSNTQRLILNGVEVTGEAIKVNPEDSTEYLLEATGLGDKTIAFLCVNTIKVKGFKADRTDISLGDTVKLTWDVENAAKVTLNDEVVDLNGSKTVTPPAVGVNTYTLRVYDADNNSKEYSQEVVARAPAKINYFKANSIKPGKSVEISWDVCNAKSITLDGISVSAIGSKVESPSKNTTYTLVVTDYDGNRIEKTLQVDVKSPRITTFKANKCSVKKGKNIEFSWTTKGAVKCRIESNMGLELVNRAPNGSVSITPKKSQIFTLIATDANGNETRESINITVK